MLIGCASFDSSFADGLGVLYRSAVLLADRLCVAWLIAGVAAPIGWSFG